MDKDYWLEMLHAYVDNELSPADRLAVESYLQQNPACRKHLADLQALKKRMGAFRDSVVCPDQVLARLHGCFGRKQKRLRVNTVWMGFYVGAAATLALAFLLPGLINRSADFFDGVRTGTVYCYSCQVAARIGMSKGDLCKGGHRFGLLDDRGKLWEVAADERGLAFQQDQGNWRRYVNVKGRFIRKEGLVIVEEVEPFEKSLAQFGAARAPRHSHP